MPKRTHEQLMKIALAKPGVKSEYDALENEFALLKEMVRARIESKKTQEDVAKAMGTSTSVVGRLETGGGRKHHSPTLATLQKYAEALGYKLQLKLTKRKA
jgi:transcriptional regulator with XRE-family HTH domain